MPQDRIAPYPNCQFRLCDLPGQCIGEGKCHHPRAPEYSLSAIEREEMNRALLTSAVIIGECKPWTE